LGRLAGRAKKGATKEKKKKKKKRIIVCGEPKKISGGDLFTARDPMVGATGGGFSGSAFFFPIGRFLGSVQRQGGSGFDCGRNMGRLFFPLFPGDFPFFFSGFQKPTGAGGVGTQKRGRKGGRVGGGGGTPRGAGAQKKEFFGPFRPLTRAGPCRKGGCYSNNRQKLTLEKKVLKGPPSQGRGGKTFFAGPLRFGAPGQKDMQCFKGRWEGGGNKNIFFSSVNRKPFRFLLFGWIAKKKTGRKHLLGRAGGLGRMFQFGCKTGDFKKRVFRGVGNLLFFFRRGEPGLSPGWGPIWG